MLLAIISGVLQLLSITFVVYKTLNYISLTQKQTLEKEQINFVVTSWILFLGFFSLKCSCSGFVGTIWNIVIQAGLVYSLLNTKCFHKMIFEENTCDKCVSFVRGIVEKYLPKQKAD